MDKALLVWEAGEWIGERQGGARVCGSVSGCGGVCGLSTIMCKHDAGLNYF